MAQALAGTHVQLKWDHSHLTSDDVASRMITSLHFEANKFAHKLGNDAAEQYQPSRWANEKLQEVDARVTNIQRRMGCLNIDAVEGELAQQASPGSCP